MRSAFTTAISSSIFLASDANAYYFSAGATCETAFFYKDNPTFVRFRLDQTVLSGELTLINIGGTIMTSGAKLEGTDFLMRVWDSKNCTGDVAFSAFDVSERFDRFREEKWWMGDVMWIRSRG